MNNNDTGDLIDDILINAIIAQLSYDNVINKKYIPSSLSSSFMISHENANVWIYTSNINTDITICFRGSNSLTHTYNNINMMPSSFYGTVHTGYLDHYKKLRLQVLNYLMKKTVYHYKHKLQNPFTINVVGHSMGVTTAELFAMDVVHMFNHNVNIYGYGGPPVGNVEFVKNFNKQKNIKEIRVVHEADIVPYLPTLYHHITLRPLVLKKIDFNVKGTFIDHHGMSNYVKSLRLKAFF